MDYEAIAGWTGAALMVAGADYIVETSQAGLDPEGAGTSSGSIGILPSLIGSVVSSVTSAVNPVYRNSGVMPTREQIDAWKRKVGRTTDPNIVPRVRTPLPAGGSPKDLRPLMAELVRGGVPGGDKGAFILCVLASIECNAGIANNNSVACWNHNLGNQKLGAARTNNAACYFLVDRVPSLDMYPSFDSFAAYTPAWLRLLGNANYNRANMLGATRSLEAGDIRQFNAALGTGGYARFYRADNAMAPRARRLVSLGSLPALQIVGL